MTSICSQLRLWRLFATQVSLFILHFYNMDLSFSQIIRGMGWVRFKNFGRFDLGRVGCHFGCTCLFKALSSSDPPSVWKMKKSIYLFTSY